MYKKQFIDKLIESGPEVLVYMSIEMIELIDFVKKQGWIIKFDGEIYPSTNLVNLRARVYAGTNKEIVSLCHGWVDTVQGLSDGDVDVALRSLAQVMSNKKLGIYSNRSTLAVDILVTAPELAHKKVKRIFVSGG